MRTPKIYLETSVFNFYFATNDLEKRRDTLKLFDEIKEGRYEPYTSSFVIDELMRCPEPKRSDMLALIQKHDIAIMEADVSTKPLADIYVAEGVIPEKYGMDALHIASATVNDMDFVVSFNFRHIVKRKTVLMSGVINVREGYRQIGIFSPTEVVEYE